MAVTASKKATYKAGKSFVLLFNRVSMYGVGHPYLGARRRRVPPSPSWSCSRSPRPWS